MILVTWFSPWNSNFFYTSVHIVLSSKLKKKERERQRVQVCRIVSHTQQKHKKPCHLEEETAGHKICFGLLNELELLPWRTISKSWREGFCSLCYVIMFSQQCTLGVETENEIAQGHVYPKLPTSVSSRHLTPLWAVLSCRTLFKWAWSTLGKKEWLVNSISLHQWAEKALDNMLWVVDLFDCIVAKWELFCNIDS